jgi:hypothetical protein
MGDSVGDIWGWRHVYKLGIDIIMNRDLTSKHGRYLPGVHTRKKQTNKCISSRS